MTIAQLVIVKRYECTFLRQKRNVHFFKKISVFEATTNF